MPRYNTSADFWNNTQETYEGCLEWGKSCSKSGYGKTHYQGKEWRAHRLAYYLATGYIPRIVMHKCDNRKCCNPSHLKAGTHKENMKDMKAKGRAARQKGSSHGQSVYDDFKILTVKTYRLLGISYAEIGRICNMNRNYVRQICLGYRWKHL